MASDFEVIEPEVAVPLVKRKTWFERLGRITSSNRFIPEIDGLRFVAIITVVLLHINTHLHRIGGKNPVEGSLWDPLFWVVNRGGLGVLLFFAISGFILAMPFASHHFNNNEKYPNLKSYYLRRLTRLEPPYIITLVLFFLAIVFLQGKEFSALFPNFVASIFYSHFFIYGTWSPINPVTWSLETEVQFYVLTPILTAIFAISNKFFRWGIILIASIAITVFHEINMQWVNNHHLGKSVLFLLPYFLVGFLFADFFLRKPSFYRQKSWVWDIIGVLALIGLVVFNNPFYAWLKMGFVAASLLLFMAAFKGKILNRIFTHPAITTTGGMCYTIYLLHYPLIAMMGTLIFPSISGRSYVVQYLIFSTIALTVLYFISAIFFLLIEKPCMDKNWPKKLMAWIRGRSVAKPQVT